MTSFSSTRWFSVSTVFVRIGLMTLLLVVPVFQIPILPTASFNPARAMSNGAIHNVQAATSSSWNPLVNCTPSIVKISDITNNQTGSSSLSSSPFSPGITSPVGDAKRWLTPGPTPPGWVSPGPSCTVTNSKGTTSLFVQINGIERGSITTEDSATSYEANNGGASHPITYDSTFNVFDPAIVSSYSSSCTSPSDPTCYARIHLEIDHDWKAAGYCGSGTVCDESALASQTSSSSTKIDFQGFVYWDSGNVGSSGHQFSGWELHPLTAWKLSSAPPPGLGVSFNWSPSTPVAGQAVTFTASVSGGTAPFTYAWTFGDGSTLSTASSSASHTYASMGSYSVTLRVTDSKSTSGSSSATVTVNSSTTQPDFTASIIPATLNVLLGSSGTSTVQLNSLNKFSGTVSLSSSVSSTGVTGSLAPRTLTLSSGGTGTATLSVTGNSVGSFTVTVTGTSGTLSHSTSLAVTVAAPLVASDGGLGPTSLGQGGGQRLIQDIAGGMIAVYIDSAGSIVLSSTPSDPALAGWAELTRSPTTATAYSLPTMVLVSPSLLEVFAIGGSAVGALQEVPVTIARDSQNNIVGFTFGTPLVIDSTGFAGYPSAVLAHNGDILLAWSWASTSSQVKSLRWDTVTGWTNFAGASATPDTVVSDTSNLPVILPSIIERPDNFNVYILGNRIQGPPSTIAYNKAIWTGAAWSWGTANLTYESNSSDGGDDPVTLAWDPIKSVVVGSYGITGTTSYGVFTLNSLDQKTHIDTPTYSVSERGYGRLAVHITTGDYYLFFMDVNGDDGSGSLIYVRHPASGSWSTTPTTLDSNTNNQGLTVRPTGTGETLDLLYVEGTAAPTLIKSARLSPPGPPDFTISANPTILTFQSGVSATSTITLTSRFSFNGTVSLTTSVTPSGLTAVLSPTSLVLTSGIIATSSLTVNSSTAGTYTITITGTSGSLVHSTTVMVKVTDFSVTANPANLGIAVGHSGSSTINLASVNGFIGTITLADTVSPSTGLTVSLNPTTVGITLGGSATSILSVSSNPPGTYTITINASSGSTSHSITIPVSIVVPPDYSVTANPTSVTFLSGSTGSTTVVATSLNGFKGTLSISQSVNPSSGLSVSCTPSSISLTSGSSSTTSCGFTSSVTGVYTVTLSATNGTVTRSANVTVNVTDFNLSSAPVALKILAGSSGNSQINLASLNGFQGTISLSQTSTSGLSAQLGPTSVTLNAGGTGTSTLSVSSSTIGNYTVTITATTGSVSHTSRVTVQVVDFSLSSNTSNLTLNAGQSGTATISLQSLGGFSGTITLSASNNPSGPSTSVNPSTIALTQAGSATSTLTFSSKTGGNYTVTITATTGSMTHSMQVTVNVLDFTISPTSSTIGFQAGSSANLSLSFTSLEGYSGTVGISTTTNPSTGLTVSCPTSVSVSSQASASVICNFSSSTFGAYTVTISATSGSLSHTSTVSVGVGDFTINTNPTSVTIMAGSSGTSSITINSSGGFGGTINLSTSSNSTSLTAATNPSSLTLTPSGTNSSILTVTSNAAGTYTVTVNATLGSLVHSVQLTVKVVDFTVSLSSSSIIILAGSAGSSTVQLVSANGFAGTVSISSSVLPTGPTVSLNPSSVIFTAGGSGTSSLSVNASTSGNYTVTITATNGSLSHSVQLTVQVEDFSVVTASGTLSVPAGSSANSTITIASLNGLSGSISLTGSVSPSGLGISLNPATVTQSANGSSSSTLTVSVPADATPGVYIVTVTCKMGSLSHTLTLTVNVPDFSISSSTPTISIGTSANTTSTISLKSIGGFSGSISLTITLPSANLIGSINPTTVVLTPGGSTLSTLTVQATVAGNYTATVTGTSGSFTHSVMITIVAKNKPQYALVTSFSGQVYKLQNGTLTLIGQPVTSALRQIAWKPDGSYALIVGDSAVLLKWDGSTLTRIPTTGAMSSGDDLNTVAWNPDGSFAIMGGTDGDLLKYDGTALTRVTDSNTHQIQGIGWNPAGTMALLVGNAGALFTYQNGITTIINSGTTNDLYGIAWNPNGAYALASGANGAILKTDGTTTTLLNTSGSYPTTTIVRFIAWNTAGTQALLVGNAGGLVLSYDGTNLTVLSSGTSQGLFSVTWSGNAATIVGNGGTMLTYSGGVFKVMATGTTSNLRGIAWKPA